MKESKDLLDRLAEMGRTNVSDKKCMLCGKECQEFCRSHSIPKFVLKKIGNDSNKVIRPILLTDEKKTIIEPFSESDYTGRIKNTGVFFLICHDCDNTFFQDYENPEKLTQGINDKLLAKIAIKNLLFHLDRQIAYLKLCQSLKSNPQYENVNEEIDVTNFNIGVLKNEIFFQKKVVDTAIEGKYRILYDRLLPYKIPIAVQCAMVLDRDMNGTAIYDLHGPLDDGNRPEYIHIAAFPMEGSSRLIAFFHERDTNYSNLWNQFTSATEELKQKYLIYLIFEYSEHIFASTTVAERLAKENTLMKLCSEVEHLPDYGISCQENSFRIGYKPVSLDDNIPNLFAKEWSI